ncbi:Phytanoyl-CoA dioxygenase (PhyH) [Actinopolymorpha cephalotaxi]|uniref:Ectoine hydroxylase-related dioxygenase (Phytanoyl-CoA dioxygenase family) n=1 Tax=Actinopolymorpha cephalotaxi TaxID=504797 RepID=A0A1I2X1J2_9ACTN|nr:phytanoyl-CoA dioxygenase family protein [Actinopolymorpha cephalotaxi]NYH85223.1 ectoine hydroxylase-related dioxygenase (phytanoyl-CoA dioxygenase family) [Actinopolymorpha cephalotaxi]SFH06749.1 Phytanoyl-CoA dioxygenase (PhyH) [Actinopolymorpha cephalotaxi]
MSGGRTSGGRTTFDRDGAAYPSGLYATPQVAEPVRSLADVGESELKRYRRDGFLPVSGALSPETVRDAVAGLEDLARPNSPADVQYEAWAEAVLDTLTPPQRLDVTRKFMSFAAHETRLAAIANDPGILDVVTRLLGGAPRMFQDMALLKPPGGGREKPWHQDNAFFHLVPGTPIVGVWIALDAATEDNGCMRIIRGSHRDGPVRHVHLRDLQICDGNVPVDRGVAVPLPPGGLMFFDGLLQHGTPSNDTTTRRRALQFHYTVDEVTATSAEEHAAVFGMADGDEC